ncbi:MAG: hypothetical protein ACK4MT_04415, partial [Thermaurantiacus tibetensis]
MRGPARLQEVIEILEDIRVAARDEGAAADAIVRRHFRGRRYIGAKDRAAIRDAIEQTRGFPGVTGEISIDAEHNAVKSGVVVKVGTQ